MDFTFENFKFLESYDGMYSKAIYMPHNLQVILKPYDIFNFHKLKNVQNILSDKSDNPYITKLYGAFLHEQQIYLVIELMDYGCLSI